MYFTQHIKVLDDQLKDFQRIEKLLKRDLVHLPRESLELSKSLTANAITLCCSSYETSVYAIMEYYCKAYTYPIAVQNYFTDSRNRLIPSANLVHLKDYMGRFDRTLKTNFSNAISTREASGLESLYSNRNKLAHTGGYAALAANLNDVVGWHKDAKGVYRKFETRIKASIKF
jgi:hypothetical protein